MSAQIILELPEPVHAYVQQQARQLGTSIEGWLLRELELQRKMQEHAEAIFAESAAGADPTAWKDLLARVPKVPPMPGDELE